MKRFISALLTRFENWIDGEGVRANEQMTIECKNVPAAALPLIAEQLRAFGARVDFRDGWSGIVASQSGKMLFTYWPDTLKVTIIEDAGHFPQALLIGGIKQTVEEACEIVRRSADSTGLAMEASA